MPRTTTRLKLVEPTERPPGNIVKLAARAARPYKTLYFDQDRGGGWVAHGSSASERGAIRAAVVRVFEDQHRRAEVYDEGVCIYTIRHANRGLVIDYGRAG